MSPLHLPPGVVYRLLHPYLHGNLAIIDMDFNLRTEDDDENWSFRVNKMLSLFAEGGPLER